VRIVELYNAYGYYDAEVLAIIPDTTLGKVRRVGKRKGQRRLGKTTIRVRVREGEDGQVLAAAASLLSAFQNAELRNDVNQRTGIDQVGVTFEDGASRPVLSLGKRLSDDLYVETALRVNPRPKTNRVEVRVEYELAPHWTLETSFGDAAIGGLDLFWEKVLGSANNPARPKR